MEESKKKKLKKLELLKDSVVELRDKQLNDLKGGSERTGCSPAGTQVNTCFTDSCCK